jgi:Tol biopolymer transport system component
MQTATRQTAMTQRQHEPRPRWRRQVRLGARVLLGAVAFQAVTSFSGARGIAADHFGPEQGRGMTTRVSVASDGTQGDDDSFFPAVSANGWVIAFLSRASTLVADDTNGARDIFVHDRRTGETERVSVATDGTQGDDDSLNVALSADGRVVAFASEASTLSEASTGVSGDTNGVADIFVHDLRTGETTRVSVATDGTEANGRSLGPPVLSADGRVVAFLSEASTLVPDDTNGRADVFVHDRRTGETTRVSVATDGTQGDDYSLEAALSADGRVVAFVSEARTLVPDDTNGRADVFVHDRRTGETTRVSVASDGTQANGGSGGVALSADGQVVAFLSAANTLVVDDSNDTSDVFVHDRQTGETTRVSIATDGTEGNGPSNWGVPALSAKGRVIVFGSEASTLVPDDTNGAVDVFVHDRQTGETTRVSVATDGTEGNGSSGVSSLSSRRVLSADGQIVVFTSAASTLVADDTNGVTDTFVRDRRRGTTTRVSVASDGTEGNAGSGSGTLSATGRVVAFGSRASTLVPDDTNGVEDVFVHTRRHVRR